MNGSGPEIPTEEEKLVAELDLLGIRYLSRQTPYRPDRIRSPEALLADLVRQPSARVRAVVIAVLLSHPQYAAAVPAALMRLTLPSFYLAAVFLQQEHANRLRPFLASRWRWLSDLPEASAALNLPPKGTPRERLVALGREHRRLACCGTKRWCDVQT